MTRKTALVIVLLWSVQLGWATWATSAWAHDTWVETNTSVMRVGDVVHIDLRLGNHGNNHRDFKLASKISPAWCQLFVQTPTGEAIHLKDKLADIGYAEKEGYWSARFVPSNAGTYRVVHTLDKIVNHGKPIRSVKSGKTYFVASGSLSQFPAQATLADQSLDLPFELVLDTVAPHTWGPGQEIQVQLLRQGKPVPNTVVSFIPRGVALTPDFDDQYERITNDQGKVKFTPAEGNLLLVVAHLKVDDEKGADYDGTAYSATLTLNIPQRAYADTACSCCEVAPTPTVATNRTEPKTD